MKVMCINTTNVGHDGPKLQYLETYHTDGQPANDLLDLHWCLIEFPELATDGNRYGYLKSRFIPLSTIDETELIRERKTELV